LFNNNFIGETYRFHII